MNLKVVTLWYLSIDRKIIWHKGVSYSKVVKRPHALAPVAETFILNMSLSSLTEFN